MRDRIFIDGADIYLRPLEKSDIVGNYKHWFDDEIVCKSNSHHRFPYTLEQLEEYVMSSNQSKRVLLLAVIHKADKAHIGNISLQDIDYINRTAEIAFILGEKKHWGKGIMKEAGRLMICHGFGSLNLNRIYCGTFSNNIGMQKLAAALGFKEEGRRRQAIFKDNQYVDVIEYGLLKTEWGF